MCVKRNTLQRWVVAIVAPVVWCSFRSSSAFFASSRHFRCYSPATSAPRPTLGSLPPTRRRLARSAEYVGSVDYEGRYIAVAGVTLLGSNQTVYAALRQAPVEGLRETVINSTFPPTNYQIGSSYPCGVPSDGNPPASFDESSSPIERAVVLEFNRDAAIADHEATTSLIIAGWVCAGVGGFCMMLAIVLTFIFDDDCKCCCKRCRGRNGTCRSNLCACCRRYEEWKLDQRVNSSRKEDSPAANTSAAKRSADFDAEGNLTHYTCEYGIGEWCGLFCRELAGKEPVPVVAPNAIDIQHMEKGVKTEKKGDVIIESEDSKQ